MGKASKQSGMFVSALVVVVLLMAAAQVFGDDTDNGSPPKTKDGAPMVKVPAGKFLRGTKGVLGVMKALKRRCTWMVSG